MDSIKNSSQATQPRMSPEGTMDNIKFPGGIGGRKVWVEMPHMADCFPGAVMWAELIDDADMYRPAQPGHAWVRQLATPAKPYPGEDGGWVSEQPWSRIG